MALLQGTDWVSLDEKALGLYEMNMQSPDYSGFHRYQIILVTRGEKPAEYRRDLGKVQKKWKRDQLRIPSYNEHTVGELQDMAEEMRNEPAFDKYDLAGIEKK